MTMNLTTAPPALSILIVDDEALARTRLRDLLADLADEIPTAIVAEASNGLLALKAVEAHAIDVVLVDIRMPKMNGIELAQHLSHLEQPPALIFVTAYDQHAVQAFELNAIDYLVKPVRAPRLAAALEKVRHQLRQHPPIAPHVLAAIQPNARTHLSCHERGRLLLIPLPEILYLKADLKYVTARTVNREYLLDESLTSLEEEFSDRFIRLHRNALVAKDAISGFEKNDAEDAETQWQALLRGISEKLPVSRRQWPLVKSFAKKLCS